MAKAYVEVDASGAPLETVVTFLETAVTKEAMELSRQIEQSTEELGYLEQNIAILEERGLDAPFLYANICFLMPSHMCHMPESDMYEPNCSHVRALDQKRQEAREALPPLEELKVRHSARHARKLGEIAELRETLAAFQSVRVR
jgi:hypothetical protein